MRTAFIILGLGLLLLPLMFQGGGPGPGPKPPTPDELSELAVEIQTALEGQPEDTAARYAGWFRAIGDTLENGDEPIPELKEAWFKAREIIGLPGVLGDITERETKDLNSPRADRKELEAAWDRLANACEELTTGGN